MQGKLRSLGAIGATALSCFIMSCTGEKDPEPLFDCASLSTLQIELTRIQQLTGCETQDGIIEVASSGGEGEVTFQLNNGTPQSSGLFEGLSLGTFVLSVTDENGCSSETQIVLTVANSSLAISNISSSPSGCETSNANLTVTAAGDGTLMYSINGGTFQDSNTFSDLPAGEYTVAVRDDICETTSLHTVTSGISYIDQVRTIFVTNCNLSGCHDGSTSLPNWNDLANVQDNASRIRTRTQNGSMPPESSGRTLTQEEKDLIACWVEDGALNN